MAPKSAIRKIFNEALLAEFRHAAVSRRPASESRPYNCNSSNARLPDRSRGRQKAAAITASDNGANKKLLAPLGSQESSEPIENTGPVMANSIAFQFQGKCS